LFEAQPLVLVAEKNCQALDVRSLAEKIKHRVAELGISIAEEVRML
jgi:UDP-N-acetylenolpyruvoylglucosamine reductase